MAIYGNDSDEDLSGDRVIYGGNGNDLITGSSLDDLQFGGQDNDILFGSISSKTGTGILVDPYVIAVPVGASGVDTLYGGTGTDLLVAGDGDDFLYGDSGNDGGVALFRGAAFYLAGLFGGEGKDTLDGGEGNDTLDGGAGQDILEGGTGLDVASYYFDGAIRASLDGSITSSGEIVNDTLLSIEGFSGSNTGNDVLAGDDNANVLIGNGGKDRLYGRGGNDTLDGGRGNDKVYGATGNDLVSGGAGADLLDGGKGSDTLSYFFESAISYALDGSLAKGGAAAPDTLTGFENVAGSNTGNDRIAGNAAANVLSGNGGNDKLYGRGGNDTLIGGLGKDAMSGGAGFDTVSYAKDSAVKMSLDGTFAAADQTGVAQGDTFSSIENIIGSATGADTLVGRNTNNTISGSGGADTLFGRAGNDVLKGGSGNDTLSGDAGSDRLDGGSGTDTASYFFNAAAKIALDGSATKSGSALGDTLVRIENISGSNTGRDTLVGNAGANTLSGNGGSDKLFGRAGNDTLIGGKGNDSLNGEDGNDTLHGGTGADKFNGGNGSDTVTYQNDAAAIASLDGSVAAAGSALGDTFTTVENLKGSNTGADTLVGNDAKNILTGNGGDDALRGQAGDDTLIGGAGADTLSGGSGADKFYFGATTDIGDAIADFDGQDHLVFKGSQFNIINSTGVLNQNQLLISNSNVATGFGQRFIFNQTDDTLWYDRDDIGTAFAAIKVATFTTPTTLALDDFLIT
jgi:Ca2+-binding RTX toxin-like protein